MGKGSGYGFILKIINCDMVHIIKVKSEHDDQKTMEGVMAGNEHSKPILHPEVLYQRSDDERGVTMAKSWRIWRRAVTAEQVDLP